MKLKLSSCKYLIPYQMKQHQNLIEPIHHLTKLKFYEFYIIK